MAATTFTTSLEIKLQSDGKHVFHKPDGERFSDGQKETVKFNVATPYVFTVTFRPCQMLQYWMIRGQKMEFSRVKPAKGEEDATTYQTTWDSSEMDITKRGARETLPIELELSDGVILKTSLQTKFYPSKETTHCQWGQELHCLELQCKVPDGHNYVDVEKQKIF